MVEFIILILVLLTIGFLIQYIPGDPVIKRVARIIVIIVTIVVLLFGLLNLSGTPINL